MPVIELPDHTEIEFPDSMSPGEIDAAIRQSIQGLPGAAPTTSLTDELAKQAPESPSSPLTPPAPTATNDTIAPVPTGVPGLAVAPTSALDIGASVPEREPEARIPTFGEPGTVTHGVSQALSGAGEFVLNKPGVVALGAFPPTAPAILGRYIPEVVGGLVVNAARGVTGDKEALGRAFGTGALLAAPVVADAIRARAPASADALAATQEALKPAAPAARATTTATQPLGITADPAISQAVADVTTPHASLPENFRLGLRGFAQESFPRITAANRETGEVFTHMAAAPMVARDLGIDFAERVVEGLNIDDLKFGAALKENQLRGKRADLIAQAEQARMTGQDPDPFIAAANNVTTMIGKKDFPGRMLGEPILADEADYLSYIQQPEFREALRRYNSQYVAEKEPLYRQAADIADDVELPTRGHDFDSFINMTYGEGPPRAPGAQREVRQLATLLRPDQFKKEFTGSSTAYEPSFRTTMADAFQHEYPIAKQHEAVRSLIDNGLAQITTTKSVPDLTIRGEPTEGFLLNLKPWSGKFLQLPKSLAGEYEAGTGLKGGLELKVITPIARYLTTQSVRGLGEGTAHGANILMKVFTGLGPTSRPLVNALIKAVPGRPDLFYSIPRVLLRGIRASRAEMNELAVINAAKEPYKGAIASKLLNPLDKGVRLTSATIYKGMAERGIVPNTETGLREFVNEVGNYNKKAQSTLVRNLRTTGIQPFATGFRTAFVQSARRAALGPGAPATSTLNAIKLRADILGGYIGMIGTVVMLNKWLNGTARGLPGTPIGSVSWKDKQDKTHYIDVGALTGYTRGVNMFGIKPYVEGRKLGLTRSQSLDRSLDAIKGGIVGQVAGPIVRTGSVALTGKNPYGTQEARPVLGADDNLFHTQLAENVKTALQEVNPIVDTAARWLRGTSEEELARRQLTRWAPRSAISENMAERLPQIVERAKAKEFIKGTAAEARKLSDDAAAELYNDARQQIQDLEAPKKEKDQLKRELLFRQRHQE